MRNTSLCHIEKDGKYLMLHRVKKENDLNRDKWVGIGGKFEDGESPEECNAREVLEETGLSGEFTRIGTAVHDGHRSIYAEFLCVADCDKNSVRLQPGETAAYKWVGFENLKSMEAELASVRCLHSYYEYGESNGNNQI